MRSTFSALSQAVNPDGASPVSLDMVAHTSIAKTSLSSPTTIRLSVFLSVCARRIRITKLWAQVGAESSRG